MGSFQLRHPVGVHLESQPIAVSAAGNNTIVTAPDGRRIKVVAFTLQATGTVNAKFTDSNSVDLTGAFSFQAREGVGASIGAPSWLFGSTVGYDLILNLSDAIAVSGFVTYFDDDVE